MTLKSASGATGSVKIAEIKWKQLRCTVNVAAAAPGIKLDIRTHAGNPETSEVVSVKDFKGKLNCSVIIEDEDLEDHECWVVILDANGNGELDEFADPNGAYNGGAAVEVGASGRFNHI